MLTVNKSRKLTAQLPWEKPDAYAFFCFGHTRFYECIGIQFFSSLTCDLRNAMSRQRSHTDTHKCGLRDAMPRQRSLTHTHVTYGTSCHARSHLLLPYPPPSNSPFKSSLTLPCTIGRFLNPFYTFSPVHRRVTCDRMIPAPYLRKRKISPGVRTILDICLRTHI